jgi:hypothetical protein
MTGVAPGGVNCGPANIFRQIVRDEPQRMVDGVACYAPARQGGIRRASKTKINNSPSSDPGSSRTIWRGKKSPQNKNFDDHPSHLTSINSKIDHHDDGNVLVTQELSDSLLAKIRWGILTP